MNTRKILFFLLCCIVLIPALPPVFVPLFEPYTFGKTELFELLAELASFLWITDFLRKRTNPLSLLRGNAIARTAFALFGAFAVSTLASADAEASFWGSSARNDGFFALAHFFLFFAMLATTVEERGWLRLLRLSLLSSAFVSLYAFFQYFTFPFVRPSDGAVFGTLGNQAYLATYLLFHVFLAFFIARTEPSRKKAALWYALAVSEAVIVLLTHNRAGIGGLMCGLILFAAPALLAKIRKSPAWKTAAAACIALALVISALSVPALVDFARNDETTQSRVFAWSAAAHGIAERPFIGHGANQFERVYTAYAERSATPAPTPESFDKPHNIIFEMLFSFGMLGLAVYAALWSVLFEAVRRTYAGQERFLWYGMFAAYGISLLFLFDTTSSLLIFFLFLAFFAHAPRSPHGGTAQGFTSSGHAVDSSGNISLAHGTAILLCFVFLFSVFHFKPIYSAYWGRALFVNAQATGILDARMKAEALRYDSFNSPFIRNAILYAEQNLKK